MSSADFKIISADFDGAFPSLAKLPVYDCPEIAFVGRSNVGKSTLLNIVTNRRKLARVGATPGTTKNANVFKLVLRGLGEGGDKKIVTIDLPGYGFAKTSGEIKKTLRNLLVDYLQSREKVSLICLLNDCRREPSEDEKLIVELALSKGRPIVLVLTKCDKLTRNQIGDAKRKIIKQFDVEDSLEVIAMSRDSKAVDFWGNDLVARAVA